MDVLGLEYLQKKENFSSPERPDRLWGPQNLLFSGYSSSVLERKRPWREGNHSSLSTEIQNEWSDTPYSPYMLSWRGLGRLYFTVEKQI